MIESYMEFWGLIGGILLAAVIWWLLSRIVIDRAMKLRGKK